jgi:hypothetical protein
MLKYSLLILLCLLASLLLADELQQPEKGKAHYSSPETNKQRNKQETDKTRENGMIRQLNRERGRGGEDSSSVVLLNESLYANNP